MRWLWVILLAALPAQTQAAEAARRHIGPPTPAQVRRVVSLAPSLSELVLALGAGELLVGVTRFDDDPRTKSLPRVGGYNDPEPEAVLALKPDLVLAQPAPANRGPVETLGRVGVPIETFPLADVGQIEDALLSVGALLGLPARASALRDQLEAHRREVRERTAKLSHPRVLLVFGLEPLVVGGAHSFAGELLQDAGGVNAAQVEQPFARLSAEAAVGAAPDVLVLCGVDPPQGRPAVPGLEHARLVTLRSTALLHPGPRLGEALDDLLEALRPSAARPKPAPAEAAQRAPGGP